MNISFFDGVNDGKFYSINAGKYDELGEGDIDISEGVNEEIEDEDADTCLNRFAALEKDASKLHMDLNNLRNEFKGSCKDWNNLSDTVDHMLNGIAEFRAMMDKVNDRVNKRLKVISEATAELAEKLTLVEKKLEVFKCIDILDRVTKLEEQFEKLEGKYTTCHNSNKLAIGRLYERLGKVEPKLAATAKIVDTINGTTSGYGHDYIIIADRINELESKLKILEEDNVSAQQSMASVVTKDIRDDARLHSIDVKLKELEDTKCDKVSPSVADDILDRLRKVEEDNVSQKIYLGRLNERLNKLNGKVNEEHYKLRPRTKAMVEDLEKSMGMSRKHTERPFESDKNDIQSDAVNHPKHYTDGKYECIDFIEEYGMVTHVGNAIKYISRNGKKDTSKFAEDLNKAFWYLHRYNTPQSMGHINAIDYCHEKNLPIELAGVIIDISHGEYKHAEELLGDYITKITGKPPKALEDEQSK